MENSPEKEQGKIPKLDLSFAPSSTEGSLNQWIEGYEGPRDDQDLESYEDKIKEKYQQSCKNLGISMEADPEIVAKMKEEIDSVEKQYKLYQEKIGELFSIEISRKKQMFLEFAKEEKIPTADYIIVTREDSPKPWERQEVMVGLQSKHYSKLLKWAEKHFELFYSWGGRIAAYDKEKGRKAFYDFVMLDRNEQGDLILKPRHQEFLKFAESRGVKLPTGKELQFGMDSINKGVYEKAYQEISSRIDSAYEKGEDSVELRKLKGKLGAARLYFKVGVKDFAEIYNLDKKERPDDQNTSYADIVYNAKYFFSKKDYEELNIPEKDRFPIIDGHKVEALLEEFGQELIKRGEYL